MREVDRIWRWLRLREREREREWEREKTKKKKKETLSLDNPLFFHSSILTTSLNHNSHHKLQTPPLCCCSAASEHPSSQDHIFIFHLPTNKTPSTSTFIYSIFLQPIVIKTVAPVAATSNIYRMSFGGFELQRVHCGWYFEFIRVFCCLDLDSQCVIFVLWCNVYRYVSVLIIVCHLDKEVIVFSFVHDAWFNVIFTLL